MSEKSKDKLFLAYANYSLREDPKNFIKIFDGGDRCDSFPPSPTDKYLLRMLVEASVISRKPDPNVRRIYPNIYLKSATEAVHGYRDGFCEHECPL